MTRVQGIEAELVTAESYKELLKIVETELNRFDGFYPEVTFLGDTKAIIYYEEIEESHAGTGRYCCECGNYEWGRKCLCDNTYVGLKHPACEHFSVTMTIKGGVH